MKPITRGRAGALLLAALLIAAMTGCAPSKYTEGVRYKDFPDEVLPVYDDAVVFEFDNDDDEEFKLSAGTKDDVDDVADFYRDYFEDEGITLTAEEEDDDEYTAEGVYEGYAFELTVKEPRGDWEKKLFSAVLEIEITVTGEPEPTATPEPTAEATPEPTEAPTPTPAPDMSADILGQWYLYDLTIDGQSQTISSLSYLFYDDKTGVATITYTTGYETLEFDWDITETALIIYWDDGDQEARQYTVDEDYLTTTYSSDGSQYVQYFGREEPNLPLTDATLLFVGAWITTQGDWSWSMSCSFWADGYGWFWWIDADGNDVQLSLTWEYDQQTGVLRFYDEENSNYNYYVICDGNTLTLYNDDSSFQFERADGNLLEGAWYLMGYVDDYGNAIEDYSFGITLIADGTGSRYDLDAQDQRYNEEPLSWYLNEYGNIVFNINGEYMEARYNLETMQMSMSMYYAPYDLYATYWFGIMGG